MVYVRIATDGIGTPDPNPRHLRTKQAFLIYFSQCWCFLIGYLGRLAGVEGSDFIVQRTWPAHCQRDFLAAPVALLLSCQRCQGRTFFPQAAEIHYFSSGPMSVDPMCPQTTGAPSCCYKLLLLLLSFLLSGPGQRAAEGLCAALALACAGEP